MTDEEEQLILKRIEELEDNIYLIDNYLGR